ncbi:Antitoxin MazE9 [Streptomyces sp. IB2014 011-1]|nr:Antitoxin MazE9 [Streptomyces sp. IB2014 011-1]
MGSIKGMKISVSLPQEDVAFVDEYAAKTDADSRSAVLHAAIELLRASTLEAEYEEAFAEWDKGEDAEFWDRVAGDGLTDAAG